MDEFSWDAVKLVLEQAGGVSRDALHVLIGVGLQLLVAAILRKTLSSWLPWGFVLLVEVANEANDLWIEVWPEPAIQYAEGAKDLVLTLLLPTLLLILARRFPRLLVAAPGATDGDPPPA